MWHERMHRAASTDLAGPFSSIQPDRVIGLEPAAFHVSRSWPSRNSSALTSLSPSSGEAQHGQAAGPWLALEVTGPSPLCQVSLSSWVKRAQASAALISNASKTARRDGSLVAACGPERRSAVKAGITPKLSRRLELGFGNAYVVILIQPHALVL